MARKAASLSAFLILLFISLPAWSQEAGTILYEDPATGQLFTRPAEGRLPVDAEKSLGIPRSALSNLYTDDSGMIYTKPGEGRTPLAEPEQAQAAPAAPASLDKAEVMEVLPDWMRRIKLGGDFRLRYQYEDKEGDKDDARHRARYRLRVGADAQVTKSVQVGFGLASGENDDRRSTNQTFTNFLSKKSVFIDYAYAKFAPYDWVSITGGRMKIPFWKPKDLVWDEDLNYEGGALNFKYQTEYPLELFANSAVFMLSETSKDDNDIFLYLVQPGLKYDVTPNTNLTLAAAYYGVTNLKNMDVTQTNAGKNSTVQSGWTNSTIFQDTAPVDLTKRKFFLKYDYDAVNVNGELTVNKLWPGMINSAQVYGDYIRSFDAPVLNSGWQAGVNIGDLKIKNAGDWQLGYNYRYMGKDAFIGLFPDSDFFGGATNVKGHEVEFRVGLLKDVNLKFDYYRAREITTNVDEDLFQADFNFSF